MLFRIEINNKPKIIYKSRKMRYKLKTQEKNYFCGPACLQAVLRNHNILLSQKEIAKKISCNETDGTTIQNIERFLKRLGFDFEFFNYNETPFNEPDFLLSNNRDKDILVLYPNSEKNHFLLQENFKDPYMELLDSDPEQTNPRIADLNKLIQRMFEKKKGGFGLISKL